MTEARTVDERIRDILGDLMGKLAGVKSVFLIDLTTTRLLASYPQQEGKALEFIGIICGNNVHQFEGQAKDLAKELRQELSVTEMEIQTDLGWLVYVSRVTPSTLLCIVGGETFNTGFARRLCQGQTKQDIILTLERMGCLASDEG